MPVPTADVKRALRAEMPYLRRRYRVEQLGLCGSYVRGDQTDDSDVDLLVTFDETPDLLEFVNLKRYLAEALGRDVDLGRVYFLRPDSRSHGQAVRAREGSRLRFLVIGFQVGRCAPCGETFLSKAFSRQLSAISVSRRELTADG